MKCKAIYRGESIELKKSYLKSYWLHKNTIYDIEIEDIMWHVETISYRIFENNKTVGLYAIEGYSELIEKWEVIKYDTIDSEFLSKIRKQKIKNILE